ncbi:MAG: hypothetical protein JSV41_12240 [Gemmatimonadota bacterium]|nr:MAG: hypothetical protein JSV41_12240 [Gemmatimonadota bacterium]
MLAIIGPAVARLRVVLLSAAGVGLAILAACDLPEAPEWDIGVMAPFSSDSLSIVDFLPGIIGTDTLNDPPLFFTVEREEGSRDFILGEMCPICTASTGQTIPVPGFDYTDSLYVPFSDTLLVSIDGVSAQLALQIANNMNFDPLRPTADPPGFVALVLRDPHSGTTIDSIFISGGSTTLPPGQAKDTTLDVANIQLTDGFRIVSHVFSPQDDQTVLIDPSLSARLTASLDQIRVAGVTVMVANDTLDERLVAEVDADTRQQLAERVQSVEYELKLIHNVEVDGTLEVSIAASEAELFSGIVNREVRLDALELTSDEVQTGELTVEEIQRIAAFPNPDSVFVGYRGVAWGTRTDFGRTNLTRLTPDQALEAELKVTSRIRVGQ